MSSPERAAVETKFTYVKEPDGPIEFYTFKPDPGVVPRLPVREEHTVEVRNARLANGDITLDRAGVELCRAPTRVTDFWNAQEVRERYYDEVRTLLTARLSARDVVVFDHNVRSSAVTEEDTTIRTPVKFVHNDYTETSGPQRLRDLVGDKRADEALNRRYAFINVWRPVDYTVEEMPLGICDARSISPEDFLPTALVYRDRVGEVYSVRYSPRHDWLYFPRMTPDEAMLLKCFDSAGDGRARYTAHSAFADPTSPSDAPPRQSIEVRTLVLF